MQKILMFVSILLIAVGSVWALVILTQPDELTTAPTPEPTSAPIELTATPLPTATSSTLPVLTQLPKPTGKLAPEQRWLSLAEFKSFLNTMGIASFPLTAELGNPFQAVDWDRNTQNPTVTSQADSGRMISLGFENMIGYGSRWGGLNVIYSTYDFAIGTEYDVYAKPGDREKLARGEFPHTTTVDGRKAIVAYRSNYMAITGAQKSVTVPFNDHYVTFVYHLHSKESYSEKEIQDMYQGKYPTTDADDLKLFDTIVSQVKFSQNN
jgi:hypothetical protein